MEQFLVGAYLQLMEGCDVVTYNTDAPSSKMFLIDVLGRDEARSRIFYVDLPGKFDAWPPEMRPDTLVKKLTQRTLELHRQGLLLEYEPDEVHHQVWMLRPPVGRVAEALPKVVERLRERHRLRLELIGPEEVARRIPPLVERIRGLSFDYDNLFIRALLLAEGRLDAQAGAPMDEDHIQAMYRFPKELPSAHDIPDFLDQFLSSREVVHWLDFNCPTFDDLVVWAHDAEPEAGLEDLRDVFQYAGEFEEEEDFLDPDEMQLIPRTYSADAVGKLTALCLEHIDALWAAPEKYCPYPSFRIDVEFMVPFLWRAAERIEASLIEREILRYGGSRNQLAAHFASGHPNKVPYRAVLRVEFYPPDAGPPPPPQGGHSMTVPIRDPAVSDGLHAGLTINYAADFTGYFILVMERLAGDLYFAE
jgi:hypothetical protein